MTRKKNQAPGLGNTLTKHRFGKTNLTRHKYASEISTEAQNAGTTSSGYNFQSVTDTNNLDDFLVRAELAGTDFTAERRGVKFIDKNTEGLVPIERVVQITKLQTDINSMLSVPRRPDWDITWTKEKLDKAEKESFLDWRRHLAEVQASNGIELTPYEKNLDFWRQLWRVVERSDVIVQIVDARDPMLYRCRDFEEYVKEVNNKKVNLLLVNKSDFLSADQRRIWKNYWNDNGVTCIFWSALIENEKLDKKEDTTLDEEVENVTEEAEKVVLETEDEDTKCLTREELIDYFKKYKKDDQKSVTIGMVGYPNVGKSSTVNTLMGAKRVAVSATPGRTKHFQTLHVDSELCLCDCPGLVFPSYVANRSEMVLCGILPIDQMRDHVGPVNLMASRISRQLLNAYYGIRIEEPPSHCANPERPPTSAEFLDAHALSRGFMTSHGQPDNSRSARIVLKDYVNGKLVYSKPPPGGDIEEYRKTTPMLSEVLVDKVKLRSTQQQIIVQNQKKEQKKREETLEDDVCIRSFEVGGRGGPKQNGKKHFNKKRDKMRRMRVVKY